VKGLYQRALRGELQGFTGVSDPYEKPLAPDVLVDSEAESEDDSLRRLLADLERRGYLAALPVK
jgi:adenylylsulfate kinase